jgi:hypothetical protein
MCFQDQKREIMYTITWGTYLTISIAILLFYYGVVFLLYYRNRISSNLLKPSALPLRKEEKPIFDESPVIKAAKNVVTPNSEGLFPQVHDLVDEL